MATTYDKDILLNQDNDIDIINGDLVVGQSTLQEIALIVTLRTGQLKSDPILGPNLIQLLKSKANSTEVEQRLRVHLARDGKDYNEVKKYIELYGIS